MEEILTKIWVTNNYSKFSLLPSNRDINGGKVKAITKSMEKKFLINPIMVNEKLQIIDGQHRFEASKKLSKLVYYYIISGYADSETSLLNTNSSNWGIKDFVKHRVINGGESYKIYKRLQEVIPINPTDLIGILSGYYGRNSLATKKFKEGLFITIPTEESLKFLDLIREILVYFPRAVDYRFIKALGKAVKTSSFSSEHFIYKLSSFNLDINERNKSSEYLEEIEMIYNYRTNHLKRIHLT